MQLSPTTTTMTTRRDGLDLSAPRFDWRGSLGKMTANCKRGVPELFRGRVYNQRRRDPRCPSDSSPLGIYPALAVECMRNGARPEDVFAPLDEAKKQLLRVADDEGLLPGKIEVSRTEQRAVHTEDIAHEDARDFPSRSTIEAQIDALQTQINVSTVKLHVLVKELDRFNH